MSAAEIIEQIKALPPQEQREVIHFVQELEATAGGPSRRSPTERPDIEAVTRRIFARYDDLFRELAK